MGSVIKVENLSKAYQIGQIGTGTISRDLERFWARVRGQEDPFLKIGEVNDRTTTSKSGIVWSLRDLNFEIAQGDAIGIIGRNGAGKSTLLKILSRVTSPTAGSYKIKGRIASLLEVGTGFHPELTGRENIYLNGTILGMRKNEIKRKFDEIVNFSGVERYIDTPVKRYSSGMYVRLAFAVAAHLESEILIVDEVLAVGDAEFQKKCLGKMSEVSTGEGRTVLFVSHNMASISQLCSRGILLDNGRLVYSDTATATINKYLNTEDNNPEVLFKINNKLPVSVLAVSITDQKGEKKTEIALQSSFVIKVTWQVTVPQKNVVCAAGITYQNIPVNTTWSNAADFEEGIYHAYFQMQSLHLAVGTYMVNIGLSIGYSNIQYVSDAIAFTIVLDSASDISIMSYEANTGIIINQMAVEIIKDDHILS